MLSLIARIQRLCHPLAARVLALCLLGAAWPGLAAAPAEAETEAEQGRETFDIWEFRIEGNTLLAVKDIERSVYDHLGAGRTIDDVEAARQGLEMLYHDRGYATVLVDIPEQDVVGGVVTLKVAAGQVERLRVTGSRYFSLGRIKSRVPALAKNQVPYLPDVQKQLAELNRATPDRQVTPVLRPGRTPGQVEVELKVKDELPLHGSLELDDSYIANTSRWRLNASLRYDNLWQKEHSLAVGYQVAPANREEVEVFSGTYLLRIPDSDKLLAFYAVNSNTDVAAGIGDKTVIGNGVIGGARLTKPLTPLDNYYHSLTTGADYKDFGETLRTQGADQLNTPISYLLFATQYSGSLLQENATSRVDLAVNFALRGLGNTEKEFGNKRFAAHPNFAVLRLNASREQNLWAGSVLRLRAFGQVTSSPLVSSEQFFAGGANSVRGYYESQVLGDDGVSGGVELRSPSFAAKLTDLLSNLRLLAFVDGATLRVRKPLPEQTEDFQLLSTGLGLEVDARNQFLASLTVAWPLLDAGDAGAGTDVTAYDPRLHVNVGYQF